MKQYINIQNFNNIFVALNMQRKEFIPYIF